MEVVDVEINKLIPYVNNAKKHSAEQIIKLAASIKEFGFNNPILCDGEKGIIAGHGRVEAAQRLNLDTVPVIELKHLSPAQKKAYILADNRLGEIGVEWDMDLVNIELEALNEEDFEVELTGFEFELPEEEKEGLTDPDDVPDVPEEAITKLGDLWLLGEHRLLCGDSTKQEDANRLMDGHKAISVVTDPPYNIDYGNIKHPKFKQRNIKNDNMSGDDFSDFCAAFALNIKEYALGCIYVWGSPGKDGRIMFTQLDNFFHCSTTVVWNKDQFILGRGKYQNKYEPCWFGWVENGNRFSKDRSLVNVWDFKRPKKSDLHPTMKPVELLCKCIEDSTLSGDLVLDLFLGSGSTLIACEKTNRKCYGMELDPHYCDVIVKRWEEYTGQKAILEND